MSADSEHLLLSTRISAPSTEETSVGPEGAALALKPRGGRHLDTPLTPPRALKAALAALTSKENGPSFKENLVLVALATGLATR